MADAASLRAPLCTEQFGSGAPRGCRAAADGSLHWEGAPRWGWLSRAPTAKPGQDAGGGGAPWAALPVLSGLRAVLLPQGFPDSVSPDYLPYQLWDSVQVRPDDCRAGPGRGRLWLRTQGTGHCNLRLHREGGGAESCRFSWSQHQ